MAEIIRFEEFQAERRRRRAPRQRDLRDAVEILTANLAAVAARLCEAAPADRPEMLDRINKLSDMIRYGLIMLGEMAAPDALEYGPNART